MTIYEKLAKIQTGLKAPKNRTNSFGGYTYRNCEDILEAVKPFLDELNCVLLLSDAITEVGGRIYVEAQATLVDVDAAENHEAISVTAYAREEETKKGMDSSQITGASSSYARKYALNGLLCLDDNKDSDATNTGTKEDKPVKAEAKQTPAASQVCSNCGIEITENVRKYSTDFYGVALCRDCQKKYDRRR